MKSLSKSKITSYSERFLKQLKETDHLNNLSATIRIEGVDGICRFNDIKIKAHHTDFLYKWNFIITMKHGFSIASSKRKMIDFLETLLSSLCNNGIKVSSNQ